MPITRGLGKSSSIISRGLGKGFSDIIGDIWQKVVNFSLVLSSSKLGSK